jgi:formamidopyrimidine-DNA glycosylase
MPELPEVETVARELSRSLVGQTIAGVEVGWARSIVNLEPGEFCNQLTGRKVVIVTRRGKWIVIKLDAGALLVHLRMSGQLIWDTCLPVDDRYVRAAFTVDDGRVLCFSDMRKFGRLWLVDDPEAALADLGPEPLDDDFTLTRFLSMLDGRKSRLKSLLLDQRFIAGLGNIYTDESFWRAGIHPERRADSLTVEEAGRLHRAIREVLQAAVDSGGTTLEDARYRDPDGRAGDFSRELAAYGRDGKPCPRCGESIVRKRLGQRSTHYCPHCQPEPVCPR